MGAGGEEMKWKNIEIPNKDLTQTTCRFSINEFLSAGELNIHV